MKTKLVPGIFIPYILVDLSSSEFDAIENHVENLLANNKLRLQKFLENCGGYVLQDACMVCDEVVYLGLFFKPEQPHQMTYGQVWNIVKTNAGIDALREKGYNMNDIIGISGLESAYEDELRGKDGVETITRNSDGVIVSTAMTTVPEPGHTVQLTVNSDFQKAVEQALGKNIDMISRAYGTDGARANAGAVVVLDVKDGSVMAASNYPSYDQNLYASNYSEYSSDPSLPLFNRALQGLYTPGSTFKPAVAVAALDSGLINEGLLDVGQLAVRAEQALERADVLALSPDCQINAGVEALPVNDDVAGAALADLAALLHGRQAEIIAQHVRQ